MLWNQTFPSLFIAISPSYIYKEMMHTIRNLKTFKGCFNTFHPAVSFFLIFKFIIFVKFFLYILWTKIDEFSPLQVLVLCLISSQERASKDKLYLIFNSKSTLKTNKLKTFYLKRKLNFSLAWSTIVIQGIRKCISASNDILKYWNIYKLTHIDLKARILIALFL